MRHIKKEAFMIKMKNNLYNMISEDIVENFVFTHGLDNLDKMILEDIITQGDPDVVDSQ